MPLIASFLIKSGLTVLFYLTILCIELSKEGYIVTAPTAADNRALAEMPLFDTSTLKCPYHYDKTLRDKQPVYQDPDSGVFVVSSYELVRKAHQADAVFSSEFTLALGSAAELDSDNSFERFLMASDLEAYLEQQQTQLAELSIPELEPPASNNASIAIR